jgi:adenylate cyclase class IV
MTVPLKRNIELKARCRDQAAARAAAESLGARSAGILNQIDTYYRVDRGRLKMREINGESAELIWYHRPTHPEARPSDYCVAPMNIETIAATKAALAGALTVRGVVTKRRELWLWHNVRIHLDTVEQLGTFIEYEAVIGNGPGEDEATARERLDQLSQAMHIGSKDQIAESYSDLLGI